MLDKFGVIDKVTVNKTTMNFSIRKIIFANKELISDYLAGKELIFTSSLDCNSYYYSGKNLYSPQVWGSNDILKDWIKDHMCNVLLPTDQLIINFAKTLPNTIVITDCTNIEETL